MGTASGCLTGARGRPGPDADAIVEGRVDSTVRADTIDDPFTVSINRARWSPRVRSQPGTDFWSDISVLDLENADRAA
jgi:hypothetical protein